VEVTGLEHPTMQKPFRAILLTFAIVTGSYLVWRASEGSHSESLSVVSTATTTGKPRNGSEPRRAPDQGERDVSAIRSEQQINTKLGPEEARMAILDARSTIKDLTLRGIETSNILRRLASDGHLVEAWNLLDPSYGLAREREIERILNIETIPLTDRMELLVGLVGARDIAAGSEGIIDSLTTLELTNFDLSSFNLADKRVIEQLQNAIGAEYVQDMIFYLETKPPSYQSDVAGLIDSAMARTKNGQIKLSYLNEMLELDPNATSFTRWNVFSGMETEKSDPALEEIQRGLMHSMIRKDAEAAMEELRNHSDSHPNSTILSRGIESWYRQDSKGANEWVVGHLSEMPASQKDTVVATVARIAKREGDIQTAKRWAAMVGDEKLREKTLKLLEPAILPKR
jgi:hypothetical protein